MMASDNRQLESTMPSLLVISTILVKGRFTIIDNIRVSIIVILYGVVNEGR